MLNLASNGTDSRQKLRFPTHPCIVTHRSTSRPPRERTYQPILPSLTKSDFMSHSSSGAKLVLWRTLTSVFWTFREAIQRSIVIEVFHHSRIRNYAKLQMVDANLHFILIISRRQVQRQYDNTVFSSGSTKQWHPTKLTITTVSRWNRLLKWATGRSLAETVDSWSKRSTSIFYSVCMHMIYVSHCAFYSTYFQKW